MTICPIGFATSGQTSRRGLREPVAAVDDLDVSRGYCGVEHFHRPRCYMSNGIGICYDEPLVMIDDAMAEEKGEGRLTSIVVLCTCCVADLVTPFTWLQSLIPHMCSMSANADRRQWRQRSSMSSSIIGVVSCKQKDQMSSMQLSSHTTPTHTRTHESRTTSSVHYLHIIVLHKTAVAPISPPDQSHHASSPHVPLSRPSLQLWRQRQLPGC